MTRADLAFYDIIASNEGKRPICFTSLADPQEHGLSNNLIFDGMVYRLTWQRTDSNSMLDVGKIETESLYQKLMKECKWDSMSKPDVYFDWHHRRMFATMQIRNAFYRLAKQFTIEKNPQKALEVIQKVQNTVSLRNWPVDYQSILLASLYAPNGEKDAGIENFRTLASSLDSWINYFTKFSSKQKKSILDEAGYQFSLYNELIKQAEGTLPEVELNRMKENLIVHARELSQL
jgi:hypothetical protein